MKGYEIVYINVSFIPSQSSIGICVAETVLYIGISIGSFDLQ